MSKSKSKKKDEKSPKPLKGFGIRADEDKMTKAHGYGIDTGIVFRQALDKELLKHDKACPTCGKPRAEK